MSIFELTMAGLPGLTMDYEDGGRVQVFKSAGREVRVPGDATDAEIIAAFRALDEKDVDA
ncbi:hypothetical protein E4K64_25455 [Bradyrhizobium frederickii]|uniref:Uncharacterized protein n=1 Tax=Bradyrhizobium frederickii TaxID=2560054 RepID=A0A4Y9NUI7_9BRAD|nr:hypothetical protein [Bradyrhizobium frederickii]TFV71679.1 hypothetical protein E4K64_25455 [Bradyrhizobium frederickii]